MKQDSFEYNTTHVYGGPDTSRHGHDEGYAPMEEDLRSRLTSSLIFSWTCERCMKRATASEHDHDADDL